MVAPARFYVAIRGGAVVPVGTLDDAAAQMVAAREAGVSFDVRARLAGARERSLSPAEIGQLLTLATARLAA